MPQVKILVDSCSYFRLAQNLHPLLSVPFGKCQYTLYAHKDLKSEFAREPRLKTKFDWFSEPEYVENRSRPLRVGYKENTRILTTYDYMHAHVADEGMCLSSVDVSILATAAELGLRIVTDDQDLTAMAEMYGVHSMTSLEILSLMLTEGHIRKSQIHQVVAQWEYDRDKPVNFDKDYRKFFGESPPKE